MILLIGRTTNIDDRVVLLCFILNPEKMSIETENCSCVYPRSDWSTFFDQ
jgi:hypothetical protein